MSLFGLPVIYGIKPHETETVPSHELGALGIDGTGRKFRYVRAGGTALVVGNLLQSKAENTSDQGLAFAAAAVGATSVTTTTTVTVDANEYANGYLVVTVTPDLGRTYRIKSHPAASAATLVITLYDPIVTAWTTDTRADLVANPYVDVIQHPATATSCPIGVAVSAIPDTDYGWIGTGGIFGVLSTGVTAVGQSVVADTAAGAIIDEASTTRPVIGMAATGIATGENGAIFLTID